jgi:hypothetical protein
VATFQAAVVLIQHSISNTDPRAKGPDPVLNKTSWSYSLKEPLAGETWMEGTWSTPVWGTLKSSRFLGGLPWG